MPPFATRWSVLALLFLAYPAAAQRPPFDIVWQQTLPGTLFDVAFSPDGQNLGAGGVHGLDGRLLIWEAANGTNTLDARLGADVNAVTFTPDGTAFVAAHAGGSCQPKGGCGGFGHELTRWAVPAGGLLTRRPYPQVYLSLVIAPDGQALVGGNDYHPDAVAAQFHDPVTLDSVDSVPAITAADVAFSPDGSRLVTGGFEDLSYDGDAEVWDLATNTVVLELPHNGLSTHRLEFPESVAYSPDGQYIATGGWRSYLPTVKVWRASDGALVYSFDARTVLVDGYGGLGTHVAFSPNGRYLAGATAYEPFSGRMDLVVRFWEVETGVLAAEYEMAGQYGNRGFQEFVISPTDNVFAFTTDNGTTDVAVARTHLDLVGTVPTDTEALPEGYRLGAAYPNPFNPTTTLTLEVAEAQRVLAEAFDVLGRRVAVLFDGPVASGTPQRLTFDAADLPSGAYVVRVEGETFRATRRVTLAR